MPNNVFTSPRATRLLRSAALTLVLCAVPATASASAVQAQPAVAHAAAHSAARAQARAERQLQRQARKQQRQAARQAQRSARQAEREQRRAARDAERSGRAGAADTAAETPAQDETNPPEGTAQGPKTGPETKPSAIGDGRCTLTTQASSPQVAAGQTVTISGQLTCPTASDGAEQQVTIDQRGPTTPTPGLNAAGAATTEADGSYTFQSAQLTGRSVFIVRSASVRQALRVVVLVTGGVSLQGPAASAPLPMAAGNPSTAKQTFAGTLTPEEAGRQVALRVRYGTGEWRTVAFARTDAHGDFTFLRRFRFAGDISVMATARTRGTQRAQSPVLTYTIAQAQNPALTIAVTAPSPPSTAPLPASTAPSTAAGNAAASEATTIAGVAAGAPHQTVTLLARTAGGRLTSVATVQSDESGAYTFTVAPSQTTVYEVSCAKQHSTQVRVQPASPQGAPAS